MIKLNDTARDYLLVTDDLRTLFQLADVRVLASPGTPPASANDAETGTLLWAPLQGGNGISFQASATGKALQMDANTLNANAAASGTADYFRLKSIVNTSAILQGVVGLATDTPTPEMILTSKVFSSGVAPTNPLNYATLQFPEPFAPGLSTGLVQHLLVTGSLKAAMDTCVMKFFSGPVPADADAALSGNTLLVTITKDGDGSTALTWDGTPSNGNLLKTAAHTWQGTAGATGTASFMRICTLADANGASASALRWQMTCGLVGSGAGVEMSSLAITSAGVIPVPAFALKLLAQAA